MPAVCIWVISRTVLDANLPVPAAFAFKNLVITDRRRPPTSVNFSQRPDCVCRNLQASLPLGDWVIQGTKVQLPSSSRIRIHLVTSPYLCQSSQKHTR